MKRLLCFSCVLWCGCGHPAQNQQQEDMAMQPMPDLAMPLPVQLAGAVQKGPFVLGSTIQLSTVDATGNPLGQVFPTKTTDDLGDFALAFTYQGNTSIEGSGYYYNEATGKLSDASLTLRAFYEVTTDPNQKAYVNIVTHLTYDRVRTLMTGPPAMTLSAATAQAESELRSALAIGGAGFDPKARGVDMNIAGGDDDANAYLFAVGAILAEIAVATANGASVDATLQQLINTISSSFATTGQISPNLPPQITAVQQNNDYHRIMAQFAARLVAVNSTAVVPDLGRVWDTDGDGIPDDKDNCPLIANPTQMALNRICSERTIMEPQQSTSGPTISVVGDFTGDGNADLLFGATSLAVYPGDGMGNLAVGSPIVTALVDQVAQCGNPPSQACQFPGPVAFADDLDGDGKLDLIADILTHNGNQGVFYGDGTGHFSTPVQVITPITTATGSWSRFNWYGVADFDGDGKKDFIGSLAWANDQVWYVLATGSRSYGTPAQISFGATKISVSNLLVGDFSGDGKPDVIVQSRASGGGAGTMDGMFLLTNNGSTSGTFNGFTLSTPALLSGLAQSWITSGDVNGDHFADLIVAGTVPGMDASSTSLFALLANGTGGFTQGPTSAGGSGGAGNNTTVVGDFTGDGKDDVAVVNVSAGLTVAISDPGGFTFQTVPFTLVGGLPLAAKVDHNNTVDLVLSPALLAGATTYSVATILMNP